MISWADQVTLAWDENTDNPDGYRLFNRALGGEYINPPIWTSEGKDLSQICVDGTCQCDVDVGLDTYFVVKAFNEDGESANSNEVKYGPLYGAMNISVVEECDQPSFPVMGFYWSYGKSVHEFEGWSYGRSRR